MGISVNQYKVILRIEENLGIKFTGTTGAEASTFISLHIKESKREEELDEVMSHVQYQEHCWI